MTRELFIDLTNANTANEGSAALLAIMVYPEEHNDENLANLQATLTHLHYRARAETDPEWGNIPFLIKPLYAFRDEKLVARDLRQLQRRLRDRMIAAKMAMPFLQEVKLGYTPKLPMNIKKLSLAQMCLLVQEESGQAETKNVENRIWRKSLPVIHLATSAAVIIDQMEKASINQPSFAHLMKPEIMNLLITSAQQHAELFYKSRLSIRPEMLIQITSN
jgi:hypothetical protein